MLCNDCCRSEKTVAQSTGVRAAKRVTSVMRPLRLKWRFSRTTRCLSILIWCAAICSLVLQSEEDEQIK